MSSPDLAHSANENNSPIEKIVSAIERATGRAPIKTPKGWQARCSAHDDGNPSLSIAEASDGAVLLKCHAGCTTDDLVRTLGLTLADLFPPSTSTQSRRSGGKGEFSRHDGNARSATDQRAGKPFPTLRDALAELEHRHGPRSALWTYESAAGEPVGVVVRWDLPDGSKNIRPAARVGDGWRLEGMAKPHPLYRLPELPTATRVYVCEGEKAADAARSLGLTATTSPHGALAAGSADWSPLAGKDVVLLPDNDEPGLRYADEVAAQLANLVPPATVRIVELPGLPDKGDVVDWIADSGDATPEMLRRELEAIVEGTLPLAAAPAPAQPHKFQPFPVADLPEPLRGFVAAGSKSIGCDPSYIALPLLAVCAAAIGNSRRIRLKRDWSEPAILWIVIIGESGTQKSPAFALVTRPVHQRQRRASDQLEADLKDFERERHEYDRALAAWNRTKDAAGDPPDSPPEPIFERFIVGDTTVEAIAPILQDNSRGVLLARDELNGWFASFDRYSSGKGGDSAHWLGMFNAADITVDRKSARKPIFVPQAAVCVAGGIQPGILHRALGTEHRESGLAARLLMCWPPRRAKRWTEAEISLAVEEAMSSAIDSLFSLQGTIDDDGHHTPLSVGLSPGAKKLFTDYCDAHGEQGAELTGDLAAAWSKLECYGARLALVLHCVADGAGCEVRPDTMAAALRIVEWFKNETRRIYGMLGEGETDRELRRLAEWIGLKGGNVTARDVQQGRRKYSTAAEAEAALHALVAAGYGVWQIDVHNRGPGRPVGRFILSATPPVYGIGDPAEECASSVDVDDAAGPASNDEGEEWGEIA